MFEVELEVLGGSSCILDLILGHDFDLLRFVDVASRHLQLDVNDGTLTRTVAFHHVVSADSVLLVRRLFRSVPN